MAQKNGNAQEVSSQILQILTDFVLQALGFVTANYE